MSIRRLLALALLAALIAALALSVGGSRSYQYAFLAPRMEPPQERQPSAAQEGEGGQEETREEEKPSALRLLIKGLREKMEELGAAQSGYGLTAIAPETGFADGGQGQAEASLQGLWGDQSLERQDVLISGRHLYYEELELGTPSAVIDERLAVDLFRVGDPLGRTMLIEGHPFTVVGIVRHHRTVGERALSSARVPLMAMDSLGLQAQVLVAGVQPRAGSGAYAALSQGLAQWQPGGSFHSLPKEGYRAMLPLRLLLCFMGLLAVSLLLRLAKIISLRLYWGGRRRLASRYAVRMLPEFAGRFLLIALMYAGILGLLYLVLQALIAPVYVFPEWVPVVLVEPREISRTFWLLREQQTALVSISTPQVLRLQYLHRLMTLCCALAAALLLKPVEALRRRLSELA